MLLAAIYAIIILTVVNFLCVVFGALVPSEHAKSVVRDVNLTISFINVLLLIVVLFV